MIEMKDFYRSIQDMKLINSSEWSTGTKIKFRNRRERRKFYSGKKESVKIKYTTMRDEFKEVKPFAPLLLLLVVVISYLKIQF